MKPLIGGSTYDANFTRGNFSCSGWHNTDLYLFEYDDNALPTFFGAVD